MRDDRYSGLGLPRHLKKLFDMSRRYADRSRPERMIGQAIKVLDGLCSRELSAKLISTLRQHEYFPNLVDGWHLKELADVSRLGLEVSILIQDNPIFSSKDALRMVLLSRSELYVFEQKLCHLQGGEPLSNLVSDSLRGAFREAAGVVSENIFESKKRRIVPVEFSIDENLL